MATSDMSNNPWAYNATGILGTQRDTMLQNQLLYRTELGKPLKRGYSLSDGFTFGRLNGAPDGGAAEAMTGWSGSYNMTATQLPLKEKKKERKTERDFIALNRASINAGLTTSQEQYQFRATHDVRKTVQQEEDNQNKTKTRRIPPNMVFGISTRPSTPVFDLLEHKYQDRWLQERRAQELAKRKSEQTQRKTSNKVYETRASILRTYQNPVEPAPLWQMSKFTRYAKPHLETFRTDRAKERSFYEQKTDGISRKGVFGQGTYEPAQS